ncbi:hypothetical protein BDV93DRAFT_510735 [Ceratobasidium sp. AG-I]|nr:hypothetical protein BDV93DRAFT_510735 [Ceratobasidium sp. AG-I]
MLTRGSAVPLSWTNAGVDVQFKQQMWSITGLAEGDHQIALTNMGTPTSAMMGVDYFEVTPGSDGTIIPAGYGPGASTIPSGAVLVDDTKDSISYSSSWESWYHPGFYFGETQHGSGVPGSTITFKFNGTAVWYFSDRSENNTIVSISLDGAQAETVNTSSPTAALLVQVLNWGKTGLSDGPHVLTITHAGPEGRLATVDFFKYMPSSSSPASNTGPKPIPLSAIIGSIVGGIVFLASVGGILIWQWKCKRSRGAATHKHEVYFGDASYDGKGVYVSPGSPYTSGTPGMSDFSPAVKGKNNLEGGNSVATTSSTGVTYTGHPEIH